MTIETVYYYRGGDLGDPCIAMESQMRAMLVAASADWSDTIDIDRELSAMIKLPDATRIVACVNGCAGIDPEAVPEMLAALERIERIAESAGGHGVIVHRILTQARAALARARGGEG